MAATRITRRNVMGQSKENMMVNQKNVTNGKENLTIRNALGEIGIKNAALRKHATIGLKSFNAKENVIESQKPKGLAVRAENKSNVSTNAAAKKSSIVAKPVAVKKVTTTVATTVKATAVTKENTSITKGLSVHNVNTAKPVIKRALKTTKAVTENKIAIEKKVETKVEEKLTVPIDEPKVAGFSTEQLKLLDELELVDKDDPQSVADYVKDIYGYLRELEEKYSIPKDYIKKCNFMTYGMRAIVIDWVLDVHRQFKLFPETLYLAVSIFDQYMALSPNTLKHQLQLVGITCLLIAAKYEEIMCPTIGDCTYMTENTYTNKQVMEMEMKILGTLKFNVSRPIPIHFLRRYTKISEATFQDHQLAKYFLEQMLVRHEMVHISPSLQAAAALCLATWILNTNENDKVDPSALWSDVLQYYSGYTYQQVEDVLKLLQTVIIKSQKSSLVAVKKKYLSKANQEALVVDGALSRISALFLST